MDCNRVGFYADVARVIGVLDLLGDWNGAKASTIPISAAEKSPARSEELASRSFASCFPVSNMADMKFTTYFVPPPPNPPEGTKSRTVRSKLQVFRSPRAFF